MGHGSLKSKDPYESWRRNLERFPVGAPGRKTIYEIMRCLCSPEEAELLSRLDFKLTSLGRLATRLDMKAEELFPRLDSLADRGLVMDIEVKGKKRYMLTPTVIGFFEFSMMRVRDDIDQKHLAELYHRYIIEEPDFFAQFGKNVKTTPFRTLAHEPALPESWSEVLDWERARCLIDDAKDLAVGICHCRHVAHHHGRDCKKFRMESCLSLGTGARFLVDHRFARSIDKAEALELLCATREAGLVHLCDNVQQRPVFICNCCGCCCDVLLGFKKFKPFGTALSSNFEAICDPQDCTGCGRCVRACPIDAIRLVEPTANAHPGEPASSHQKKRKVAQIDHEICLGCGVCVLQCPERALQLRPRALRQITPESTYLRVLTMALERGVLQDLLIDPREGFGARSGNLLIKAALRLPPNRQVLLHQAVKSRFIKAVIQGARKAGILGKDF